MADSGISHMGGNTCSPEFRSMAAACETGSDSDRSRQKKNDTECRCIPSWQLSRF